MDENTFDKVVHFFMTFVVDFCKKSTVRELPSIMNVMTVYNMFGSNEPGGHQQQQPAQPQELPEEAQLLGQPCALPQQPQVMQQQCQLPPQRHLPQPPCQQPRQPPSPPRPQSPPRSQSPQILPQPRVPFRQQNYSLAQYLSDQQLTECVRRGLEYVKANLRQMQNANDGIPVAGGSIESWRFENISLDIISQDTRLHNVADYNVEGINVALAEGKIHVGVRWPMAHLTETYILRGSVDNKRVYGAGRFRISVVNFTMTALCYFVEEESTIKMRNVTLSSDFEDAQISISGLEVEGNDNAEQLMNNAIQRDKQKFREILHRNMEALSKEVLVVLNLHLGRTHKSSVHELVTSWCNLTI